MGGEPYNKGLIDYIAAHLKTMGCSAAIKNGGEVYGVSWQGKMFLELQIFSFKR